MRSSALRGDRDNARLAEEYLTAAGLWDRVRYRVGDALEGLAAETGDFDVVYCDVDKPGYPDCWRAGCERIRVGGLWLCDNVIWSRNVATGTDEQGQSDWTGAIREHNRLVAEDSRFVGSIVPIRDGVMTALRTVDTPLRCRSQYTSFRFTAHLIGAGIDASIGTGGALDNALAESAIGLYRTELIKPRGPHRNLSEVDVATATWVGWYNNCLSRRTWTGPSSSASPRGDDSARP